MWTRLHVLASISHLTRSARTAWLLRKERLGSEEDRRAEETDWYQQRLETPASWLTPRDRIFR